MPTASRPPDEPDALDDPPVDARGALGEVLDQHLPAVHRYVQRRMGSLLKQKESASDIVQSVCREVLQDVNDVPHVVDDERELRHWLLVTAARKLVNRSRYNNAEKRNPGHQLLSLDHSIDDEGAVLAAPDEDSLDPGGSVELREEMQRLEEAVSDLPDEYRQVFLWRHVHGQSRPEIAARLGKSPNAVSKLLGRATARLARVLREKGPGVEDSDGD